MKRLALIALIVLVVLVALSSCSFEAYGGCPAYSGQNKTTKYGQKAQGKYVKKSTKRNSLI